MNSTLSSNLELAGEQLQCAMQLLDHLVLPTFVLDREGQVIVWNQACERLTGVSAAKMLGTRKHWRAFYAHPRPCLADLVLQNRLNELDMFFGSNPDSAEVGLEGAVGAACWCDMPRRGEQRYLAMNAQPIYGRAGELMGVLQSVRDMTREKRTQAELERLISSDGLTGLVNRRHFDRLLHQEWARLRREKGLLSLLLIDVDHFQAYLDVSGQLAADVCLQRMAQVFSQSVLRPSDVAARYDDEVFALVLPDTDMAGSQTVAERIQEGVKRLDIQHMDNEEGRITVSMGLATVNPSAGTTPAQLLVMADDALHRAKLAGRNRFIVHTLGVWAQACAATPIEAVDDAPI